MIKISKQIDYALQLIFALDKQKYGEYLSLKKFSTESTISFLFLQKIAKSLREQGIITAEKGKFGGYCLRKPVNTISLREVVEAVEGPIGLSACTRSGHTCSKESQCTIKPGIQRLNAAMTTMMNATSIADMISSSTV